MVSVLEFGLIYFFKKGFPYLFLISLIAAKIFSLTWMLALLKLKLILVLLNAGSLMELV
jgi:hypothetical protein